MPVTLTSFISSLVGHIKSGSVIAKKVMIAVSLSSKIIPLHDTELLSFDACFMQLDEAAAGNIKQN